MGERLLLSGEGPFPRVARGVRELSDGDLYTKMLSDSEHEKARALVLRFGWNATAYQILNPGIELWFSRIISRTRSHPPGRFTATFVDPNIAAICSYTA